MLGYIAIMIPFLCPPFGRGTAQESVAFELRTSLALGSPIRCLAVHPKGKMLVCGGGDSKAVKGATFDIHFVDVKSGKVVDVIKGHKNYVTSIVFDSMGKNLLVTDEDGIAEIYSVEKKPESKVYRVFSHPIKMARLLDDNRAILLLQGEGLVVWNYTKNEVESRIKSDRIKSFEVDPLGKAIVAATTDRSIEFWPIDTDKPRRTVSFRGTPFWAMAISHDGKSVALGSVDGIGEVVAYPVNDFSKPKSLKGQISTVHCLAFSTDGCNLFAANEFPGFGKKKSVVAWDLKSKTKIFDHEFEVGASAIGIGPNNEFVGVADSEGNVFIFTLTRSSK